MEWGPPRLQRWNWLRWLKPLRRLFEAADVPDVPEDSIAPEPLGAVGVVEPVVVAAVVREVAATAVVAAAEDDDVELAALVSTRLLLSSFSLAFGGFLRTEALICRNRGWTVLH